MVQGFHAGNGVGFFHVRNSVGFLCEMLQGYKLTHITFTSVMVTLSSRSHSTVQGINKDTPFTSATSMAEAKVLPFKITA